MEVLYIGSPPETSVRTAQGTFSFHYGKSTMVPDDIGLNLISRRSDFIAMDTYYKDKLKKVTSIGIRRGGGLGDVISLVPAINAFHEENPKVKIFVYTKEGNMDVFNENESITEVRDVSEWSKSLKHSVLLDFDGVGGRATKFTEHQNILFAYLRYLGMEDL